MHMPQNTKRDIASHILGWNNILVTSQFFGCLIDAT